MNGVFPSPEPMTGAQPISTPIAVSFGDGIGPEIMRAVMTVLARAKARLEYWPIEVGEKVYRQGFTAGITPDAWNALREAKVFLKAPVTTPQGGGFKSLNVTIRKSLGLYANVRPCTAYPGFIKTAHPHMDVVVIRENEEDLYAGIEHRQTDDVYQCLKLVSRPGCERICRYAFEYAKSHGRKKVTCMTKDNIMKLTDGLFHRVFDEIGEQYPEIEKEHRIIDIGMAQVACRPEMFDVIVTPNLYGDILSDVAAEVAGSVGLAPSGNIGDNCAMFEAIHGSAPDIAGQDIANPSGLLLAAVMMLVHVGQPDVATRIHNAWLRTIEDGIHTRDVFEEGVSACLVGTQDFADAVCERLDLLPRTLTPVHYSGDGRPKPLQQMKRDPELKQTVGVDIFVQWTDSPSELASRLKCAENGSLGLQMITNRGVKVWPEGFPETLLTDHWRCRFISEPQTEVSHDEILQVIEMIFKSGLDFIKAETLCTFDGKPGFSLGQGQ